MKIFSKTFRAKEVKKIFLNNFNMMTFSELNTYVSFDVCLNLVELKRMNLTI